MIAHMYFLWRRDHAARRVANYANRPSLKRSRKRQDWLEQRLASWTEVALIHRRRLLICTESSEDSR